jgi:hypothetical protein
MTITISAEWEPVRTRCVFPPLGALIAIVIEYTSPETGWNCEPGVKKTMQNEPPVASESPRTFWQSLDRIRWVIILAVCV